jgi:hypothetical protein
MKYMQSPNSPARITSPPYTHAYTQSAHIGHLNPLHTLNQSSPIPPLLRGLIASTEREEKGMR